MILCLSTSFLNFLLTVQAGGKTRAKAGVKLAYQPAFAPVFTSDGRPMLLVRPWPGKKISRPEPLPFFTPLSLPHCSRR